MSLESTPASSLKKWKYEPCEINLEVLQNKNPACTDHCVPTKNQKGYAFSFMDEPVDIWASSLPESSSPLVDLGAGYGFQTIAALKKGRNVIAVDMDDEHLKALRSSVRLLTENAQKQGKSSVGNLVDTKIAALPDGSLFSENNVAGVLLSEVVHFCSPGEPLLLFNDAYRWLQPGGLFVVTAVSPAIAEFSVQFGAKLHGGRSMDDAWNILSTGKDDEVINSSATFVDLSTVRSNIIRKSFGNHLYCFTTNELCALARCSGFEIEEAKYLIGEKYPLKFSKYDNEVLLVAKKPLL